MPIRPCLDADIPAIAALYRQAVTTGRASFELDPPSDAEMALRRAALIEGGFPYLVAEIDGDFAGYAYAGPYRARPAYRSTVENSVYVSPGLQGRGIGRRLLDELIEEASRRDFRQMIAVIGDSANLASIRLHAAAGFTDAGILRNVGWKHGMWLDTVFMQRALGSGCEAPSGLAGATP